MEPAANHIAMILHNELLRESLIHAHREPLRSLHPLDVRAGWDSSLRAPREPVSAR